MHLCRMSIRTTQSINEYVCTSFMFFSLFNVEKQPGKKRVGSDKDDKEIKSVFGKVPQSKRKAPAFDTDESDNPTMLRQVVQGVLRRMEAIFGVDD